MGRRQAGRRGRFNPAMRSPAPEGVMTGSVITACEMGQMNSAGTPLVRAALACHAAAHTHVTQACQVASESKADHGSSCRLGCIWCH
jgi:hypothetical protein